MPLTLTETPEFRPQIAIPTPGEPVSVSGTAPGGVLKTTFQNLVDRTKFLADFTTAARPSVAMTRGLANDGGTFFLAAESVVLDDTTLKNITIPFTEFDFQIIPGATQWPADSFVFLYAQFGATAVDRLYGSTTPPADYQDLAFPLHSTSPPDLGDLRQRYLGVLRVGPSKTLRIEGMDQGRYLLETGVTVVSASSNTSPQSVDLQHIVPPTAKGVSLFVAFDSGVTLPNALYLADTDGGSPRTAAYFLGNAGACSSVVDLPLRRNGDPSVDWWTEANTGTVRIDLVGFWE